jgi:hypothetical protein
MLRLFKGLLKLGAGLVVAAAVLLAVLYVRASARDTPEPVDAPPLPARSAPMTSRDLTPEERGAYYHLSEGGELYPLDWLLALETETSVPGQPATRRRFLDNIERYGMLPDPKGPQNPYGLPVGVSFGRSRLSGQMMMGLNCTACHVGQVEFNGQAVRIDGGPSMAFVNRFIVDMLVETEATLSSPRRLKRFWGRVRDARAARLALGRAGEADGDAPAPDDGTWQIVKELFTHNLGLLHGKVAALRAVPTLKAAAAISTLDGYGRTDAFGVGRNELFGTTLLNAMPSDAPVSFPHTWGMEYTAWLQWGANTNSVMERNIGQALGVGAIFDPKTGRSSVRLENLHRMEQLTYKLRPPSWPAAFPAVDAARAERGRARFVQYCAPCHETWQQDGEMRVYKLFALNEVGTDPNTALNYEKPVKTASGEIQPFPQAALALIKAVKEKAYSERGFSPQQIAEWENRAVRRGPAFDPIFRAPLLDHDRWDDTRGRKVYRAKTLVGIWATAPYLHNGSVPTLYDLLLPAAERPTSFPVGQHEYDPVKLGIQTDPSRFTRPPQAPPYTLDTRLSGNWNTGHEWRFYPQLDDEQRYEIIEFLKTFDDEAKIKGQ